MRFFISSILILILTSLSAQNNTSQKAFKVIYHFYNNGVADSSSSTSLIFSDSTVYLSKPDSKISYYTDFKEKKNITTIKHDNKLYSNIVPFDSLPEPTLKNKYDTILGYSCMLANYKVFSNNIDVWFTEDANIKGSPYRRYLPSKNSLVLKVVINGNRTLIADSIAVLAEFNASDYYMVNPILISDSELEELKIESRYRTISIFEDEKINFDPDYWKDNEYNSETEVYHFSKGTIILKELVLPNDLVGEEYFFLNLACNSEGDAYDRTGSVFLISVKPDVISMFDAFVDSLGVLPKYIDNKGKEYQGIIASEKYDPPLEIMRFFTSFGVDHFNNLRPINNYNWEQTAVYKQDVTDNFPVNAEKLYIGIFIGNYDKGGHRVSLELDIYPSFGSADTSNKYVKPIFNTVNIMEMSGQNYGRLFNNDSLKGYFTIPDSLENIQLVYTSTGHGGWGGGDEFNQKRNQIFIDGKLVYSVIPWRTDCATYRYFNPASGNFGNGLSSSDLSRSNWCPATLTPPYYINLDSLDPGTHSYEIIIDQGDDSGGSFSSWNISGNIIGNKK